MHTSDTRFTHSTYESQPTNPTPSSVTNSEAQQQQKVIGSDRSELWTAERNAAAATIPKRSLRLLRYDLHNRGSHGVERHPAGVTSQALSRRGLRAEPGSLVPPPAYAGCAGPPYIA